LLRFPYSHNSQTENQDQGMDHYKIHTRTIPNSHLQKNNENSIMIIETSYC